VFQQRQYVAQYPSAEAVAQQVNGLAGVVGQQRIEYGSDLRGGVPLPDPLRFAVVRQVRRVGGVLLPEGQSQALHSAAATAKTVEGKHNFGAVPVTADVQTVGRNGSVEGFAAGGGHEETGGTY